MPFKSEAQRRYLWVHEPALAKKWAHEHPHQGKLAMHVRGERRKKGKLASMTYRGKERRAG
jgi:hypothetical protein